MTTLNITFENKAVKNYDNNGAHDAAKLIMKKNENLSVKFKTDKDNYPYAWLESKSVAGFKLRLNQEELNWIMKYLTKGETEDFGTKPADVEAYKEGEDNDFQLKIFKQLIESGKVLQFIPTFRETNGFISATASYMKGKIFFRLERTENLVEYLQEKELI